MENQAHKPGVRVPIPGSKTTMTGDENRKPTWVMFLQPPTAEELAGAREVLASEYRPKKGATMMDEKQPDIIIIDDYSDDYSPLTPERKVLLDKAYALMKVLEMSNTMIL